MSWSGWYLRNSSISAILRSVIGVVTPFRLLVVLLLEGNAPVTFSVNHRPDSTGFYTLPGTLTVVWDEDEASSTHLSTSHRQESSSQQLDPGPSVAPWVRQRIHHRVHVLLQAPGKAS